MDAGKPGYGTTYYPAQQAAPPPNYVVHRQVEGAGHGGNPYVYMDKVAHDPWCRYVGVPVSPERRRKNRIANALAAAFVVCWCCTWPCHGPCCCGL